MGFPSTHDPAKESAVFTIEDGIVKTGCLLCADDGRVIELMDLTVTVVDGVLDTGTGADLAIVFGDNVKAADFGTLTLAANVADRAKGTQYGWRNNDITAHISWRRNSQAGAPVELRDGDCLYWYFGGGTTGGAGKVCVSAHYHIKNPRSNKKD